MDGISKKLGGKYISPGTKRSDGEKFHTRKCRYYLQMDNPKKASDSEIEYHGMELCSQCEAMEEGRAKH